MTGKKSSGRNGAGYDVIIVGGGPAGLSAALVLGRSRRRVLVCDSGVPRNAVSHGLHGYLTRDGIQPLEFLRIAREELRPYDVEIRSAEIVDAYPVPEGFEVVIRGGGRLRSRKLLVATGVTDRVPEIEGVREFYGRSVHHCPYCDGWEWRDHPLAVYGRGRRGLGLALSLKTWSDDVILCTDGPARLERVERERLERHGIALHTRRIERLEGEDGFLKRIRFRGGAAIERSALFFNTGQDQRCSFAGKLGCRFTAKGAIWTDQREETTVAGLYVAGDASRDVQFVIIAAAEGAKAAVMINNDLQSEDRMKNSKLKMQN